VSATCAVAEELAGGCLATVALLQRLGATAG
jgi:hypothetical protein